MNQKPILIVSIISPIILTGFTFITSSNSVFASNADGNGGGSHGSTNNNHNNNNNNVNTQSITQAQQNKQNSQQGIGQARSSNQGG
jgi:hypothetical protein